MAHVQAVETSVVGAATTIAIALSTNPVVGNELIVWVRAPSGATVSGVADTLLHSYAQTAGSPVTEAGTTQLLYQFRAKVTSTGANTVTATYSGSVGNRGIYVLEVTGNFDVGNMGTDTGNNPTTTVSATATAPGTAYMLSNFVQGGTPGVGTGFTDIGTGWATVGLNCRAQFKTYTAAGSQGGNFVNATLDRQNTGIVLVADLPYLLHSGGLLKQRTSRPKPFAPGIAR